MKKNKNNVTSGRSRAHVSGQKHGSCYLQCIPRNRLDQIDRLPVFKHTNVVFITYVCI